jgi:anti-sigma factor RsiW
MGLSANTKSRPNPSPNKPPTAISIEEKPKKASGTEADHVKDSVDSEQVFEEEIRTLDVDLPQRYGVNFLAGYFSEVLVRTKDLTSAKVRLSASILFGMIIGWAAHNSLNASANSDFSEVAQSAIDAHVFYTADSKHAVEVSVKYKTQLRNWIKKNLESELEPVNLSKFNYALLGGRVLPLKGKLAGQYMYQNNRNKSRLTIYMSNYVQDSNAGKQPHCEKIEGSGNASLSVCGWKKADLIFYVVANLPTSEISQVADRIKKLMPKKKT